MNSVRKCNNLAASCSNKARTVFTRRQCRTFTGPRHKAFVNTKIMVFRRRFPCKTINAVFYHHWRQQNSLVKHVCNLEPKFKKTAESCPIFYKDECVNLTRTFSILYIKLSVRTTQRTQFVFVLKRNYLILYSKIISMYCNNSWNTHIYIYIYIYPTICGQKSSIQSVHCTWTDRRWKENRGIRIAKFWLHWPHRILYKTLKNVSNF